MPGQGGIIQPKRWRLGFQKLALLRLFRLRRQAQGRLPPAAGLRHI